MNVRDRQTDRHEIWYGDAYLPLRTLLAVKISNS